VVFRKDHEIFRRYINVQCVISKEMHQNHEITERCGYLIRHCGIPTARFNSMNKTINIGCNFLKGVINRVDWKEEQITLTLSSGEKNKLCTLTCRLGRRTNYLNPVVKGKITLTLSSGEKNILP